MTREELDKALAEGEIEGTVADICTREEITAFPDESIEDAFAHLHVQAIGRIPIVDR